MNTRQKITAIGGGSCIALLVAAGAANAGTQAVTYHCDSAEVHVAARANAEWLGNITVTAGGQSVTAFNVNSASFDVPFGVEIVVDYDGVQALELGGDGRIADGRSVIPPQNFAEVCPAPTPNEVTTTTVDGAVPPPGPRDDETGGSIGLGIATPEPTSTVATGNPPATVTGDSGGGEGELPATGRTTDVLTAAGLLVLAAGVTARIVARRPKAITV